MLQLVGFTKEEIQEIVRDKLSGSLLKPENIETLVQKDKKDLQSKTNGARQKVIHVKMLE